MADRADFLLLSPEYMEDEAVAVDAGSSGTATGKPWTNLLTPYPFQKARTTNLTAMKLILDLGQARAITDVWIGYSNARSATQVRHRLADTSGGLATAAGDDDSGTIGFWPAGVPSTFAADWPEGTFHHYRFASSRTRRWYEADFTDGTHPDGFLQFGALILASAWKPTYGLRAKPNEATEVERPERSRSYSGYVFPVVGPRPAGATYSFTALSFAEYRELRRIYRLRGASKPVVTIENYSVTARLPENTIHGLMTPDHFGRPTNLSKGGTDYGWQAQLAVESMAGR